MISIEKLIEKKTILLDGAMGTMLYKAGFKKSENTSIANITDGEKVVEIHKQYISAGVDIILANTFRANKIALKNSEYSVEEIITKAIKLAKIAKDESDVLIALDIGPIGELIEPRGSIKFEEAIDIFKEVVKYGVKSGVDILLIETMYDLNEMKAAILACKEESILPIFAAMTFREDEKTFLGDSVKDVAISLNELGVSAIGVNCTYGEENILNIIRKFKEYSKLPIIAKPNIGLPKSTGNEEIYELDKKGFKMQIEKIIKEGVTIIGGCCGTTPEFIEELNILKNM